MYRQRHSALEKKNNIVLFGENGANGKSHLTNELNKENALFVIHQYIVYKKLTIKFH